MTFIQVSSYPKSKAQQRPFRNEHRSEPLDMSEQKIGQICQIAKQRVERVLRRDYGRARRLRLDAADVVGRSERTITRWARGETDPSMWDVMCLIASTGNVDLLRAFLEPFGYTVAKTDDIEAVEKLRTAEQLRPFLQVSLPGLKALMDAWEAIKCQPSEKIDSTLSGPTEK